MTKKTRKPFAKNPDFTKQLGRKLRARRRSLGYTIDNMVHLTEISKNTCVDIEKGKASGIDYYIEYSKALEYPLPELFNIDILYEPRHKLPDDDLEKASVARKIMYLKNEKSLFNEQTYVHQVKTMLVEENLVEDNESLSSTISGVLLNWCSKEEGFLKKKKVEGNNNVYWLSNQSGE